MLRIGGSRVVALTLPLKQRLIIWLQSELDLLFSDFSACDPHRNGRVLEADLRIK
jgi:hypothetical protein